MFSIFVPINQVFMDEKVILQVLAEQREEMSGYDVAGWISRPEEDFFEWDSDMAQVVIGVRRSGKSTLCHKALIQHGVKYGYSDLDDDRLLGMEAKDLNTLLGCMYQLYGVDVKYLFFDEIQDVPGWHLFVNRLLRQGLRIVLTGSNAKLLSSELATHLTGRYNEIKLYPFSYAELCDAEKVDVKGITTKADAARKIALEAYLNDGGFPELMKLRNPRGRRTYIEGLIETIITKDIAKRFNIRNPESIRRIAYHLINNSCQVIDYKTLAEISNLKTAATAQKYTSYLAQVATRFLGRIWAGVWRTRSLWSCFAGIVPRLRTYTITSLPHGKRRSILSCADRMLYWNSFKWPMTFLTVRPTEGRPNPLFLRPQS